MTTGPEAQTFRAVRANPPLGLRLGRPPRPRLLVAPPPVLVADLTYAPLHALARSQLGGRSRRRAVVADRHRGVEERRLLHGVLPRRPAGPAGRGARGGDDRRLQRLAAAALRDRAAARADHRLRAGDRTDQRA